MPRLALYRCSVVLNVYIQVENVPQISHVELKDSEVVGQGGYGVVYRAKHGRFGDVAYKELNTKKLGDRYLTAILLHCNCISEQTSLIYMSV